jgi:cyclophilin family peptidyl-prolyl cis-trans isomerase
LLSSPSFPQIVRSTSVLNAYRKSIIDDLISIFESDDAGAMAAACTVVRNETLDAKNYIELKAPLRQALRNLKLPEETETQYEIESVIDFLNDTTSVRDFPAFNHPIAWESIAELSDSARAYINTTKGQIAISLSVDAAPGSVANFVKLANDNFYDGKFVHRVVPNFVIQTGCPRGDGYGGLGYSIRSELSQSYYDDEGYIGMASAGKDTEGTQWFITHSPTPHLDGRYTIFGKVIEGMDVVHAIQPGDIIQDIRILKR